LHDIGQKRATKEDTLALDPVDIAQHVLLDPSQGGRLARIAKLAQHQKPETLFQDLSRNGPDVSGFFMFVHRLPAK